MPRGSVFSRMPAIAACDCPELKPGAGAPLISAAG
jgi:hypothetical protein